MQPTQVQCVMMDVQEGNVFDNVYILKLGNYFVIELKNEICNK